MMYSEFVENTGCKDTEYNREVFRRLEIAYMNDDTCTKEWVYESGKKLVNNSLTEEQKHHNKQVRTEIKVNKDAIAEHKKRMKQSKESLAFERSSSNDKWYVDFLKRDIKYNKESITDLKMKNKLLAESIIK